MSDSSDPINIPNDLTVADCIDLLCDAFERDWLDGNVPRIEAFLGRIEVDEQTLLFRELLRLDLDYRTREGTVIAQAEYVARFPSQIAVLHDVFETMRSAALTLGSFPSPGETALETLFESTGGSAGLGRKGWTPIGVIADYELLLEIARGGMGVVYLARQRRLNRLVAVKMILSEKLASEDDVKRFYLEAESAAKLEHPHIVPIYEVGEFQKQHFYSMAFVDGPSLSKLLQSGPLSPRDAADLDARSDANLIAFAGDTDSTAIVTYDSVARVTGQTGAFLATLDLNVTTSQPGDSALDARAERSGALFDGGSKTEEENNDSSKTISWNATVLLGGISPELEVSPSGNVTKAVGVTINDSDGMTPGPVTSSMIVVNSITNSVGDARFEADTISGSSGKFIVRPTFDNVSITNQSTLSLQINDISVTNTTDMADIEFVSDDSVGITFAIDFDTSDPTTTINIRNLNTSATSDLTLNGFINNPIGTTNIVNTGGDILDAGNGLVRTNILDIKSTSGSIGRAGGSPNRVDVELINSAGRPESMTGHAGVDIFLGLTGISLVGNSATNVSSLTAGNDVNVVLQPFGDVIPPGNATSLRVTVRETLSGGSNTSGTFSNFFRPNSGSAPTLNLDPFNLSPTAATGSYDFGLVTAGNDIDINAANTGGATINVNATTNLTGAGEIDVRTNGEVNVFRIRTTSVGTFAPNAWGLYDMHGNVGEWCHDRYTENYSIRADGVADPVNDSTGAGRVIRGGHWLASARMCRSACRFDHGSMDRCSYVGFRVVMTNSPPPPPSTTARSREADKGGTN